MEGIILRIFLCFFLLFLSFLFSGTEAAIFSLSPSQIWRLKTRGRSGRMIARFVEDPLSTMISSFTGNEIMNVFITSLITYIFSEIFGVEKSLYAFFVAFPLILIFGDILPKTIGIRYPEEFSLRGIFLIRMIYFFVGPVKKVMLPLFEFLFGRVDVEPPEEEIREEILDILEKMKDSGELSEVEANFAKEMIELKDDKVYSVMTPRTKLFQIPVEIDFLTLKKYIKDVKFSRIPVYRQRRDEVIGILYVKDILPFINEGRDFDWTVLIRKPYFVPENKTLISLFREFRLKNINFAMVVDEFGNIIGAVTARDLLRGFLIGAKIQEPPIKKIGEKRYIVDAMMPFDEFVEELSLSLDEEGFWTTVGSYFIEKLGRIPKEGDEIEAGKIRMRALDAEQMSLKTLEVEIIGE
jgi:putative hemolysin